MLYTHLFNYLGNGAYNYAMAAAGAEVELLLGHQTAFLIDQILRFDYIVYFHCSSLFDIKVVVESGLDLLRCGNHTTQTAKEAYGLAALDSQTDILNHLTGAQLN